MNRRAEEGNSPGSFGAIGLAADSQPSFPVIEMPWPFNTNRSASKQERPGFEKSYYYARNDAFERPRRDVELGKRAAAVEATGPVRYE